jgi:hypothetical protein
VASCTTSRGGSSAAEIKKKGVQSCLNRDGVCACIKVFDGDFSMEEVAREGSRVLDRVTIGCLFRSITREKTREGRATRNAVRVCIVVTTGHASKVWVRGKWDSPREHARH